MQRGLVVKEINTIFGRVVAANDADMTGFEIFVLLANQEKRIYIYICCSLLGTSFKIFVEVETLETSNLPFWSRLLQR